MRGVFFHALFLPCMSRRPKDTGPMRAHRRSFLNGLQIVFFTENTAQLFAEQREVLIYSKSNHRQNPSTLGAK